MEQDSIKNNIKTLRRHLKLSQKEMAERLNIDRNTYRNLEIGKTKLFNPMLDQIAEICGVTTEDLIVGTICFPEDLEKFNLPDAEQVLEEQPSPTYSLNQFEMAKRHNEELVWIKSTLLSISEEVQELRTAIDELAKKIK